MKITHSIIRTPAGLTAAVLLAVGATIGAQAAAPALQGQLVLRPLTPQDIKDYSLTGAQGASGLDTIGVGQPAYLEVLVNYAVPDADITNVVWTISSKPVGSVATLAASPLGTNVPTYNMANRFNQAGSPVYKVGGASARTVLRPDVTGQYVVGVTIQTTSSGSTNLSQAITAGTYMGAYTCALCHSGGVIAQNIYPYWTNTGHATFFTRAIDGLESDHYGKNCISCHTVGYDTNTNAVNGGFDDVATALNWQFPAVLTNGNWAALPSQLKALANIQCENCHGPGSEHAASFGNTNVVNWPRIDRTFAAGDCAQCHDSKPNHPIVAQWNNSVHARTTRTPSGANRSACVRCHTSPGFAQYVEHQGSTNTYVTNTVYEAIGCSGCHDPHDASKPHQLRVYGQVTLPDGTMVTNAGPGALCMTCHHARNGEANANIANYKAGLPTWAGGSSFGVHDSTAGDMIQGLNAITYGREIPSGSHAAISNLCVTCHMQPVASTDPAWNKAGGHTFSMTYMVGTNTIDKVDVCIQCHGPIDEFNMVRQDYDGDGVTEGVQTEIQHLLDKLARLLPNSTYRADGNYVADGLVKSPSTKTNWQDKFLKAAWNWQFVNVEGSHGIHNTPYAVGALKASIADLTGDANMDGLPDDWQIQYFGSAGSATAAPNFSAAGDGIPNWLKYTLGLNPLVKGVVVPDGVVWANTGTVGGAANTVHIYTAAEIAFDTAVGKNYQIQGASTVGGGWQNIGDPIPGTGSSVSYVTKTSGKNQQFYRVVSN